MKSAVVNYSESIQIKITKDNGYYFYSLYENNKHVYKNRCGTKSLKECVDNAIETIKINN